MKLGLRVTTAILFALLAALCLKAGADGEAGTPTGKLTLTQALALAEERHPVLASSRLDAQAADARVIQTGARQNPTSSVEVENFGGKGEQSPFDAAEYTVQVEQTLELGGKRAKRMRVATVERRLTGFDLEGNRLDIRAETRRRFVGVLGAQERVSVVKESIALAEDVVKAVAARVESGKVPPMELEKSQVLLEQRRIVLDQTTKDLEAARIRLAEQWGAPRPVFQSAAGNLAAIPVVPPLTELKSRIQGNPDVARWSTAVERAQALLAKEKAARVPDVALAGGIRHSGEAESQTFIAGVSLPLPVFDRNQGGIREATALLSKASQQQRAADMKTAVDLAAAHLAFAGATNRVLALEANVLPRVKAVFDAVQSGYIQGKFTYLEVLDAQRTLAESRAERMDALIAVHIALADLERIVGGQLPIQK